MVKKFRQERRLAWLAIFVAAELLIFGMWAVYAPVSAATIRVPQDHRTIRAGINAAENGDVVLVSPGTYNEQLTLSGKTITLASLFHTSGDEQFINDTIIDGGGNTVITVNQSVGPDTQIIGFTIRNGNDGIQARTKLQILNNRLASNADAIDYTSGGGVARHNFFENNSDGAAHFEWNGETVLDMPPAAYAGAAPDLGWSEANFSPPSPTILRFAVIGDYGTDSSAEQRVAELVDSWNPDFVITTGDNNYPDGEASTIDVNIGKHYSRFIGNYQGAYGPGSETNRFWPSLGNHDWNGMQCNAQGCSGAYLDYFTLPGNERYYDADLGLVHLFAVDSDSREPDGRTSSSVQAGWLQNALAASTACFDVVTFHHPPYSSGIHGSTTGMRWPFRAWGADVVMSGHDHAYERIDASGFPYFVNGSGGASLYGFLNRPFPAGVVSVVRYYQDYGAMLVTATNIGITYQFFNANGVMIDELSVDKDCGGGRYEIYLPLITRKADAH